MRPGGTVAEERLVHRTEKTTFRPTFPTNLKNGNNLTLTLTKQAGNREMQNSNSQPKGSLLYLKK